jgi:hypothetical protein
MDLDYQKLEVGYMKKLLFLVFIAVVASAVTAQVVRVAPTKAVVDFLVSQGADAMAIEAAKANAPDEALFLAPGAPSAEALAKIMQIIHTPPLDLTPVPTNYVFDAHQALNDVVFSELWKQAPANQYFFTPITMKIGDVVWTIQRTPID